jgi:FAD/FMN-containing dehydrogenase
MDGVKAKQAGTVGKGKAAAEVRQAAQCARTADLAKRLGEIVGKANVLDDPKILEQYARDRSFAAPIRPRLVVKAKTADEVQKIVQLANEMKTPLVPVSSGGPHYKGDTVPSVPEAGVGDLSGMKKILSVNRQQRVAVVEPGVTYGELLKALEKEGLTISLPLAPRATKSVVASVLDMEPRLNSLHQWNFIDPLRCTEVVWGDGNRMYTGEAGGSPRDLEAQWKSEKWQVSGTGPMMLDFYRLLTGSQGTMGIVTWASLKCDVNTKVHKMYIVPAAKLESLNDFVYRVLRLRFSNELFVVNGAYLAYLMGGTKEKVRELMGELPAWAALVGIAGREILPEERVEAQEKDIAEIAQQFGLKMVPAVPGVRGEAALEKANGSSGADYWKETYKGAFQDVFFTTTLDRTPGFVAKMYELADAAGYSSKDIGVYIQPQNMGTSVQIEFSLPYDGANPKETQVVRKLFCDSSREFSAMGAYFLRPHGIWAHLQLNKDAQSYGLLKKMKDIFDPNNVMNTGKLSI